MFYYQGENAIMCTKGCGFMNTKYKYDFIFMGKRIASARKLNEMTQEKLAHRLGIGVKHLSEIERGVSGVAIGTLIELVKILNISSDYLLFGEDITNSPLNVKLQEISPYQKQYLEEMIDTFINCCMDERCFPKQEKE